MKNKELESKRPTLFLLGVISALSLTLMAFEWRTEADIYTFPFDLIGETFDFEPVMPAIVVEPKKKPTPIQKTSAPARNRSNQFEIVPDIMPAMAPGPEMSKLNMARPERPGMNGLDREIKPMSNVPTSVRRLQPHELPYMKLCGHIKDDVERFQCTQVELKKYMVNNFKIPSSYQMEKLPGRIEVTFTINSYGSIIDVKADKEYHSSLKSEIERVMKNIPEMIPATVSGQRISVRFELPIVLQRY